MTLPSWRQSIIIWQCDINQVMMQSYNWWWYASVHCCVKVNKATSKKKSYDHECDLQENIIPLWVLWKNGLKIYLMCLKILFPPFQVFPNIYLARIVLGQFLSTYHPWDGILNIDPVNNSYQIYIQRKSGDWDSYLSEGYIGFATMHKFYLLGALLFIWRKGLGAFRNLYKILTKG